MKYIITGGAGFIGSHLCDYLIELKSTEKIIKNYNAVIEALEKEKSNLTIKGDLVKQVFVTSSMGVSYKIKLENNL